MVNSGHLTDPVSQGLVVASWALLQWTLSSLATHGTAMKKQSNQQNPKNTNEQQLFLETRNGNIRSSGKLSTAKAEEGYCSETTRSGSLTHSQSHEAQNTVEHRGKTKYGLDKRGNKRSDMVLYVLQTAFYRKLQENV